MFHLDSSLRQLPTMHLVHASRLNGYSPFSCFFTITNLQQLSLENKRYLYFVLSLTRPSLVLEQNQLTSASRVILGFE